ncbi:MAG: FliO/MopB family protein [Candidatus Firestonebacteria bacterium]|nr:FliO/MopB family protein [Candidatus Firestonebacteria bacterium]
MDTTQLSNDLFKLTDSAANLSADTGSSSSFIPLIISLCIILGVIFLILGIIKKYNGKKYLEKFFNIDTLSSSPIKIVSKISVGSKKQLLLVKINDKELLLGVTENNINLLSQSESKEEK